MNVQQSRFDAPTGFSANRPDLAHMPERPIGPILAVPAARLLRAPDGREIVVEPLVMQVLLALAEAGGETLSRDDLVATCWGRRIVGDDAVNRAISHLRRDLARVAGDRVRVETIAKVGYRLAIACLDEQAADRGPAAPGETGPRASRKGTLALGLVAIAALLGSAIVARPGNAELALAIEQMPGGGDRGDRGTERFVGDLSTEIARLTGPMTDLTVVEPGAGSVDLILKVSVAEPARGAGHAAFVRLVDAPSGAVVWSREFAGPTVGLLRERAAYGTTGVLRCGLHRSSGDLGDPVSKRLYLAACDAVDAFDWPRAHSFAEQIVERRPDSPASWACLAMITATLGQHNPATRETAAREAMRLARKALAIDPNSGLAHQAIGMASELSGSDGFGSFEEGVRRDPEHGGLLAHYSRALASMGYVGEAVEPGLRAHALEPNNFWLAYGALSGLIGAGRMDAARDLGAHIQRIWGDTLNTGYTRHALGFYDPDPVRALARFDRSPPSDPLVAERQRFELAWRLDPANADWAAFDRAAARAHAANPDNAWFLAFSAIRMGDRARAFDWLGRAEVTGSLRPLAPLFWPDAAELRRDPRFFAKMAEVGLLDKWRARGRWPDFCSDSRLAYDCRRESRRLAAAGTI
jgi:DNA-binding winged helix-turn-helix (wHTH) protein/tetratricopeptide (TPR) repeat protein